MNSLEYIDLLIKSREEEVNRYTKVKNNLYFNESKAYYEKEIIGKTNEQIKQLQQIKTKLEAWKIVAPVLIEGELVGLSYFLKNDIEKFNTIKKALEVEYEQKLRFFN